MNPGFIKVEEEGRWRLKELFPVWMFMKAG